MIKTIAGTVLLAATLVIFFVASAGATNIMGPIGTTLVITNDSKLIGNVTCTTVATPCIKFGAGGISLELKGFTITGLANPITGCGGGGPIAGEDGISTGGQNKVKIEGPGLVGRFRNFGIDVAAPSHDAEVEGVTVSTNCNNGIEVGGSHNKVEENFVARNSSIADRACGGIEIEGNDNLVRHNEAHGNGLATGGFVVFNDFGISLTEGTGNRVEENSVGGNVRNGIKIAAAAVGNVLKKNQVVGNPSIQDSISGFPGVDILNESAPAANTFDKNLCETSSGPDVTCPNFPKEVVGHENP